MTRARRTCKTLALLLVLCTLLAFLPAASADAAEADQGFAVECSGNIFTIRRSDTSSAADVSYRTVSQSAVEGIHFTAASGTLHFNPGDSSRTVAVSEVRAVASADFFYLDGSARTYGFEVLTTGGRTLASCQRILDSADELALSSGLYSAKTAAVFTAETKVTDKGYIQAYYPVPLDAYSAGEMDYFDLTGARLRMTVDLEAKEADDGYQYIQIIANSSGSDSGAGSGNPGTVSLSSYMAGFGHDPGSKNTSYAKYTFPLTTAGNNCAAIEPAWNFSPYNNSVGKLYTQMFAASARADDGRIILPENLRTLGIRLNASGDNDDDWYAKNVTAKLQATDTTAPTLLGVYVTDGVYGYRDTITAALRFSEVVRIVGTNPYLNTNMGSFSYAGGSGTNVLYFTRFLNTSLGAKNGLEISGIGNSTNIHDLSTKAFTGSYTASFPNVSYEGSVSVTINYNNGSGATANAGSYYLGAVYTFPEAARYQSHAPQGHELDCYKVGETAYQPGDTLELTENLTVDLQWKPIVYTVRFVNHDGTVLQSGSMTYGETPEYTGETPTRPADAQYTYTFSGWDKEITAVSGDITYTASYSTTTNPYTVTFKKYDGTVLQSGPVPYGETPAYAGPAPTKEPTTETAYTFAGWTPELAPVTGEAAYTAVFTEAARPYTITFKNYDGTVLQSGPVPYGETPEYTGETPARPDEGETRYTFAAWTPEITAVAGEASYTASYSTTRIYPVTLPEGITADKAFAEPGELVTLTAPAPYSVALTYTPEGDSPVSIPVTEGAYTFTMPAAPVTVGADFSLTWANLQILLDAGGTVKLLCDVTADEDSSWLKVPTVVTVTLDLNGHTVDRALTDAVPGGNVLEIYGSLTLRDSSAGGAGRITGGKNDGSSGGVYVDAGGTFTMEGGAITDNTADYGGGVYVDTGGTFNMTGGTITDNTAIYGGGVLVEGGTFNMTGGTITDNTAYFGGGGVYVDADGTFTMEGGTITDNTAGFGGGVYVDAGGTFTMEGGAITNNTANYGSGGVYVFGTFNMTGGTISGNTAYNGGGVYVDGTFRVSGSPVVTGNLCDSAPNNVYLASGKTIGISGPLTEGASLGVTMMNNTGCFTDGWADQMGTADPADFFTSDDSAYPVNHRPGSEALLGVLHTVSIADGIELGTVTADKASAVSGETVTLTVTAPEAYTVALTYTPEGGEAAAVLETEGAYTFTMPAAPVTVGADFSLPWEGLQTLLDAGGTVKLLCDVTADADSSCLFVPSVVTVTLDLNGHTVDRALTGAVPDGNVLRIDGSLTLRDSSAGGAGRITGGKNYGNSGGVFVEGMFTMEGGTITDNTADYGGGVFVYSSGTFNMTGGMISGNTVNYGGGCGGGVYVSPYGRFTMTDGTISGNTASGDTANYGGGGVYVEGMFTMEGGAITNNTATYGGGVYVYVGGMFRVSGSPVVTGNLRKGAPNNVYLYSDRKISLSGPLTEGASLGVKLADGVIFTNDWPAHMGDADPADFFTSDDTLCGVFRSANGEAALNWLYTVSIADGIEHGTVTADKASACEDEPVTLTVTPEPGFELETLTVKQGETEVTASANGNNEYTFLMPDGDVTVTATFWMTWAGLNAALQSDGAITLLYDITAEFSDGPLVIPGGVTVTLDLNGHILSRGLRASTSDGYVIGIQSGGSLTLTDSAPDTTHDGTDVTGGILTGGYNSSNYGGGVYVNGGSLTMSGGTVTGNTAAQSGGGVAVCSGSTFTMSGGTITGNTTGQDGGGVYVFGKTGDAVFIMESGTISNNTANGRGGGVHVGSKSSLTMSGGTITGNTAAREGGGVSIASSVLSAIITGGTVSNNTAQNGGGVLVNGPLTMTGGTLTGNTAQNGGGVSVNSGIFTMSGGTVKGNTAAQYGGGVYNGGMFKVAGSPVVTGNMRYDAPNNVYLGSGKTISISGPLTEGASLGVTMTGVAGIFTSGWAAQMGTADPADFFTSDYTHCGVFRSANGEAALNRLYTVSIADGIGGSVTLTPARGDSKYAQGETVTLTVTPETGFALETLTVTRGETSVTVTDNSFTMPAGDVTVTATFRPAFGTPDFTMPAALQIIEESAFEGMTLLHVVDAGSVTAIGKWAFKDTGLTQIRLPQNCAIDADAFDGCGTVYVFAPAGGTTESFCQNRPGIVFAAE